MKACCKSIKDFKVFGILNTNTTVYAAEYGHLDCLKYAHENGCPWDDFTTLYAGKNGHLDCLKYAHENGCPWYGSTTLHIACRGHLDCLKYAHENGCPWDIKTTMYAAKNSHLDCLKYAHENGCPWHPKTTLSRLEKHVFKIDLDDKWWRSFLFERDLTTHLTLKNVVDTKKEEIRNLQEETTLLFPYISKDITQYVLWTYF